MIKGIERIEDKGELLALIARSYFKANNLDFITENHHSFQIGFHTKKKGVELEHTFLYHSKN